MNNTKWTIGIDEVGRGPLAGPVAVGVFAVNDKFDYSVLDGIRDSKKLTEKKRIEWRKILELTENSKWAVGYVGNSQIDDTGITKSIKAAMLSALNTLNLDPGECNILLDGSLYAPEEYTSQKTIIKGDQKEPCISAAAILAKVDRDEKMKKFALHYPEYGLEKHKGYGTKLHREMIQKYGLSPIHRKSFCRNILK